MKTGSCGVMQCLQTNSLMTAKTASNIRMELHHRLVQLPLQPHVLYILIFEYAQGANTACNLQQCTSLNCSFHMINSRMMIIQKIHISDIEEKPGISILHK
jgi:hypothetical protein